MMFRNYFFCCMLILLTWQNIVAEEEIVFTAENVNTSGQPIKRLERIQIDGSGRTIFDIRVRNHDNIFHPTMVNYDANVNDGKSIYEIKNLNWAMVRDVLHPDVSPIGKKLVFRNCYTIHSANWDGSGYVNLTPYRREWNMPKFSHDGKKIVLVADKESNSEIYTMRYDGSLLKNVSSASSSELSPVWSPDDSEIAFISNRNGKFELFKMTCDGKKVQKIASLDGDIREPVWSSRNEIAFALQKADGKSSLWKIAPDGNNLKQLTDGSAWDGQPSWNADGNLLAFVSNRSGHSNIWLLDVASGKKKNLTNNQKFEEFFPAFVPKQISDKPLVVETANINGIVLPRPRLLFLKEDIPALREKFRMSPLKIAWDKLQLACDKMTGPENIERKKLLEQIRNGAEFSKIARDFGFVYQITGEKKYGEAGAEILTVGTTRKLLYTPDAYGDDANLAYAFDWLESCLKSEDRKVIVSALCHFVRNHVKHIQSYFFSNPVLADCHFNIATYEMGGGNMALAVEGESGADENALNCYIRVAEENGNNWIDNKGGCAESFSYFIQPTKVSVPFLVSLKLNNLAPKAYDNNLKKFSTWMALCTVNGLLPNLDDADPMVVGFSPGFLKLYPEDLTLKKLWNSVPRPAIPPAEPLELLWFEPSSNTAQDWKNLPGMEYFSSANLAVFREETSFGPTVMTFKESGGGHAHNECGGIQLRAFGRDLLTDPGQAVHGADKHSQLLIDGRGRLPAYNNSGKKFPLTVSTMKGAESVSVALVPAFASGVVFHSGADYAVPCAGFNLKSGTRTLVRINGSGNVPSYFLLHDTAALNDGVRNFEQNFILEPDMEIQELEEGNIMLREKQPEFYWKLINPKEQGELKASFQMKSGNYSYWGMFAKEKGAINYQSILFPENQRLARRMFGLVTRSACWQWLKIADNINIKEGKHELKIFEDGNIGAVAFVPAEKTNEVNRWDTSLPEGAIVIAAKEMQGTGNRWKQIDSSFVPSLQIAQLGQLAKLVKDSFSFRTRFYGQVLINLNRIKFIQTGNNADFITLLYPNVPIMPRVQVRKTKNGFELHWSNGVVDYAVIQNEILIFERKGNRFTEKRSYSFGEKGK